MGPTSLLRRNYVVQILLDGNEKSQKEIFDGLKYYYDVKNFMDNMEKRINKKKGNLRILSSLYYQLETNKRTLIDLDYDEESKIKLKKKISNLGKDLEEDGIISIIPKRSKGRGGRHNVWVLNRTLDALNLILVESTDPRLSQPTSTFYSSNILFSDYGQSIVNKDLIESLINEIGFILNKEEFEIILNIVKISPRALSFLLSKKSDDNYKEMVKRGFFVSKYFRESFLYSLLLNLGRDIDTLGFISPQIFEYTIKIDFNPEHLLEDESLNKGHDFLASRNNDVKIDKDGMIVRTTPFININEKKVKQKFLLKYSQY